jgi:hypothetical protein
MTDNIENIVIEHLKALRGELKEFRYKLMRIWRGIQAPINCT